MAAPLEYRYRTYDDDSVAPNPSSPFFLDHVSRYWWATRFTRDQRVLDCATGNGYGAYVVSRNAREVVGVDLNPRSLSIARGLFDAPNLTFRECDVLALKALGRAFDVVTAFEIIEHLPPSYSDDFVAGLVDVLEPGGLALISTPNHDVVMKSGVVVPEFHINNLRPPELRALLRRHFREVELLGQFRERRAPMKWVFALDIYNFRHVVGRRRSIEATSTAPPAESGPPVGKEFFARPCAGVDHYRFSRWHWRQAGLTLAMCRR